MSKNTLNILSTVLGLVAGGSSLLGSTGIINHDVATSISGIATAFLGYLVHQPAAKSSPNSTEAALN
jgi:hypothetical protein